MSCGGVTTPFQMLFTFVYQQCLRPKVIQKEFVPSSLFWSDLTEGNYVGVSEHYSMYGRVSDVVSMMNKAVGHNRSRQNELLEIVYICCAGASILKGHPKSVDPIHLFLTYGHMRNQFY